MQASFWCRGASQARHRAVSLQMYLFVASRVHPASWNQCSLPLAQYLCCFLYLLPSRQAEHRWSKSTRHRPDILTSPPLLSKLSFRTQRSSHTQCHQTLLHRQNQSTKKRKTVNLETLNGFVMVCQPVIWHSDKSTYQFKLLFFINEHIFRLQIPMHNLQVETLLQASDYRGCIEHCHLWL